MLVIENQSNFFQTKALPSLLPLRNTLLVLRATVALSQDWKISVSPSRGSVSFKRKEPLRLPDLKEDTAYTHITVFLDLEKKLATKHHIPESNGVVVALELSRLLERWPLRARISKECGRQYLNPEDTLKDGIIRKYHFNSRKEHHFDLVFLKCC